jgi:hypothetical protein
MMDEAAPSRWHALVNFLACQHAFGLEQCPAGAWAISCRVWTAAVNVHSCSTAGREHLLASPARRNATTRAGHVHTGMGDSGVGWCSMSVGYCDRPRTPRRTTTARAPGWSVPGRFDPIGSSGLPGMQVFLSRIVDTRHTILGNYSMQLTVRVA